jgi:membrane protein YqaA with SNARE-associated domain
MHKVFVWVQEVLVPFLGAPGIFIAAFLDSSFLSIPEVNDFLMVTSCAAHPERAPLYIAMTTLGSLAGCSALWWLGKRGGEGFLVRRFGAARVERTRERFKKWDVMALAIPSLLPPPMPFKIFVLSAGVFGIPYRRLALTLIVARGCRYLFWGVMGIVYGDEALALLRSVDRWFGDQMPIILTLLAAVAVALGTVYGLRKRRAAQAGVDGAR